MLWWALLSRGGVVELRAHPIQSGQCCEHQSRVHRVLLFVSRRLGEAGNWVHAGIVRVE